MSIIDTFDGESAEVIRPCDVISRVENFPETVIVTFKNTVIDLAKDAYGAEKIDSLNEDFELPVFRLNYKGKSIGLYQTLIGGAASAALIEEVAAKGARKFVFFGSCGTLDKTIPAGHVVVPEAAFRDEGTSYHYAPPGDFMNIASAGRLAEILAEINVLFIKGRTWTTDAFYRETRNTVAARKKAGYITVEMECASIMAVAAFRKVPVYQFLYSEDNLDDESWDPRTMGSVRQDMYAHYLKIALEIALRV